MGRQRKRDDMNCIGLNMANTCLGLHEIYAGGSIFDL